MRNLTLASCIVRTYRNVGKKTNWPLSLSLFMTLRKKEGKMWNWQCYFCPDLSTSTDFELFKVEFIFAYVKNILPPHVVGCKNTIRVMIAWDEKPLTREGCAFFQFVEIESYTSTNTKAKSQYRCASIKLWKPGNMPRPHFRALSPRHSAFKVKIFVHTWKGGDTITKTGFSPPCSVSTNVGLSVRNIHLLLDEYFYATLHMHVMHLRTHVFWPSEFDGKTSSPSFLPSSHVLLSMCSPSRKTEKLSRPEKQFSFHGKKGLKNLARRKSEKLSIQVKMKSKLVFPWKGSLCFYRQEERNSCDFGQILTNISEHVVISVASRSFATTFES